MTKIFLLVVLFFTTFLNANNTYEQSNTNKNIKTSSSQNDKTIIREYTYKAKNNDTELSAKITALQHLKIILSEEIGTAIESNLELVKTDKNKLFKKEINSISISLTKLKILDENWDGKYYYIKAQVSINEKQTLELLAEAVINKGYKKEINKLKDILDEKGITISSLNETIKELEKKLDNSVPIVKIITKTKAGLSVLARTYGYYLGQEYRLNQIKKIFPDLGNDTYMAHLAFKQKFGTSLETIKKHLDENHIDMSYLDKEFKKYQPYNKEDSIRYINVIKERAIGVDIESPVIETLLMYDPIYDKYPEREFKDNYRKIFKSDGSGKAKGVEFEISVPQSWKSMEAKRPNIVRKFIAQNGYGVDKAQVMVIVKKLPLPEDMILTKSEIEEYFITEENMKQGFEGATVVDYGKFEIENQPGYWQKLNIKVKRGMLSGNTYMLQYGLFYKNRIIAIQFSAGMSLNGNKTKAQQIKQYEKFKPLFTKILNSFILPEQYKDKEYIAPKEKIVNYYVYKLFDDKFQAVFPDTPNIQAIPKELLNKTKLLNSIPYNYRKNLSQKQIDKMLANTIQIAKKMQPYVYIDIKNQVSYSSKKMPSQLEHKNYRWSGIKKTIDNLIKDPLKADGHTILEFSSTLDKYNDTYIAIFTSSYFIDGQKIYKTTKQIYYKDKTYTWTVSYVNKEDKSIFDDYQHNVKVLK